jgi:hypothetical protein
VRLREGARGAAAGVPDAPLSVGPRLSAMAVYLPVFQHVPVERAQFLIADLTGGVLPAGFVHSCLGKAAGLVTDAVRLIRTMIAASPVAGFDETTLRSGPAGDKKYVHGAFTELYSAFWLGTRSIETMKEAGILPSFAGIVVSDRYQGYYSETWANFAGHQACAAHVIRDFQDCAETYPGASWPEQAMRSLRGLIHAWHAAREQGLPAIPDGDRAGRWRLSSAAPSPSAWLPSPASPARGTRSGSGPAASSSSSAGTARTTSSGSRPTPASGRRTTSHQKGPRLVIARAVVHRLTICQQVTGQAHRLKVVFGDDELGDYPAAGGEEVNYLHPVQHYLILALVRAVGAELIVAVGVHQRVEYALRATTLVKPPKCSPQRTQATTARAFSSTGLRTVSSV